MIKCLNCINHRQDGREHSCTKCETKKTYGTMQEPFLSPCLYYEQTEESKIKEMYLRRVRAIPDEEVERPTGLKLANITRSVNKKLKDATCEKDCKEYYQGRCNLYGFTHSTGPAGCKYYKDMLRKQEEEK